MNKFLDFDYLIDNYYHIHYFGLGFIQVKLTPTHRVHFYTDAFEKTTKIDEIHNHRYGFVSHILSGELINETFKVSETIPGEHIKVATECIPNAKPMIEPVPVFVCSYKTERLWPNQSYAMKHETFHQTVAKPGTITLLERGPYEKEYSEVIHHKDFQVTCPFSIDVSPMDCFKVIKEILNHER